jgi:hypothetical protein
VVEDFPVRRRFGRSLAFDDLDVYFRPVTRLANRIRILPPSREIVHELHLDYNTGGPCAEISLVAFALLEPIDGRRTLASLAGATVV